MVFDVSEAEFQARVVERSRAVPVVVDFWAAWCGPCRQLTPALERAATAREGRVDLAKVDVDANQALAQAFRVQGIPAVKAFRDGRVASEFTGAVPPAEVERFFDALVPSEADELAARAAAEGDEAALRRALELDPRQLDAARALARLLLARDEAEQALELVEPFPGDFLAAGLAARARLSLEGDELDPAFAAWDRGDHEDALERLQEAFAAAGDQADRDLVRQVMVGVFTELGPGHPLAREHRRRLSLALY
jgi:putative thioredoxin